MNTELQTKYAEYMKNKDTYSALVASTKEQELQDLNRRIEEFQAQAYICIVHAVGMCDEYPRINPIFRGPTPYDGTIEAGHHWIAGVLALERLQPDPVRGPLVETLVASELSALARLDLEKQWPRSLGWGLWALAEAARTGAFPKEHRREIRRFRNHLLARRANSGVLLLTKEEGGMTYAESPFVQGGILVPAIAASLEVVPDAEQRGALAGFARAWLRLGMVLDEERFGLSERVAFDRRGNVIGRSGRAEPEFGALFAAGLVAAEPELSRDPTLRRLVALVSAAPLDERRRYLGRNLSVLLRSLPWLEGEDRRPGAALRR